MSDLILETHGLTRDFLGFRAVSEVDLRVRRGTIHALIGPNGAGKTTVFNLLARFLAVSAGRIIYEGNDITDARPSIVARNGLVRSFQISAIFPHLTVRENIRLGLQSRTRDAYNFWRPDSRLAVLDDRVQELAEAVGFERDMLELTAVELPYGRRRALEIATTLALEPRLLLLDEPMSGLGREDIQRISKLIRRVAADRTVLMVEHNLSVVAELSDMITVMARGKLLVEGPYEKIAQHPAVIEAYMGR